jgi:2,4-dienoyl-CoA reductase-like NADH-dependent reductase (Old Yellow Enzyme family)
MMMKMFNEVQLENITIKNKIVRSATHSMLGNLDGTISEAELDMFEELAKNKVGLIIAGQFFVNNKGIVGPGSNELTNPVQMESASKILKRVESYGSRVIAQLNHAGALAYPDDQYGPSPLELAEGLKARMMTAEEIEAVKADFIKSAKLAKEAGFHGIQLHAAHDYLLCEFITPSFNKREDAYGGHADGRFKLVEEIIKGIKEACGDNYPVFIKVNANAEAENERYQEELKSMLKKFKKLGVEAVEFSGTGYKYMKYSDHNYFLETALAIKGDTDIPLMVVGGVRTLDDMTIMLDAGIDMVSISRPFISEPDLITKLVNGQEKARCVSCNKCIQAGPKRCILNVKKA